MKANIKHVGMLAILILALGIVGCGANDNESETQASEESGASVYTIGDTVESDLVELNFISMNVQDEYGSFKPEAGNKILVFKYSLKNIRRL